MTSYTLRALVTDSSASLISDTAYSTAFGFSIGGLLAFRKSVLPIATTAAKVALKTTPLFWAIGFGISLLTLYSQQGSTFNPTHILQLALINSAIALAVGTGAGICAGALMQKGVSLYSLLNTAIETAQIGAFLGLLKSAVKIASNVNKYLHTDTPVIPHALS